MLQDFCEFLLLTYLWSNVGPYTDLIHPAHVAAQVQQGIDTMERCYSAYDKDRSHQLSRDEFQLFMSQQLPQFISHPAIAEVFPSSAPILSFRKFLFLLYRVVMPSPAYARLGAPDIPPSPGAAPGQTPLWTMLKRLFKIMEQVRHCASLAGGRT